MKGNSCYDTSTGTGTRYDMKKPLRILIFSLKLIIRVLVTDSGRFKCIIGSKNMHVRYSALMRLCILNFESIIIKTFMNPTKIVF